MDLLLFYWNYTSRALAITNRTRWYITLLLQYETLVADFKWSLLFEGLYNADCGSAQFHSSHRNPSLGKIMLICPISCASLTIWQELKLRSCKFQLKLSISRIMIWIST